MEFPSFKGNSGLEVEVSWITMSYRAIAVIALILLLECSVLTGYRYRDRLRDLLARWFPPTGAMQAALLSADDSYLPPTIHKLQGTVRLKRVNTGRWTAVSEGLALHPLDALQTGETSAAELGFAAGMNCVMQPRSLLLLEENVSSREHPERVRVQFISGNARCATGELREGSKARIDLDDATLQLLFNTTVQLTGDSRRHLLTAAVIEGSAEVRRGDTVLELAEHEMVTVAPGDAGLHGQSLLPPPVALSPTADASIVAASAPASVLLAWRSDHAFSRYLVRVGRDPDFVAPLLETTVTHTQFLVPSLSPGEYYWQVQGVSGADSLPSSAGHFTVIAPSNDTQSAAPVIITSVNVYGNVAELAGTAEPGVQVIISGDRVAMTNDGTFHYLTPPLPVGAHVLAITAEDTSGNASTQTLRVVVR